MAQLSLLDAVRQNKLGDWATNNFTLSPEQQQRIAAGGKQWWNYAKEAAVQAATPFVPSPAVTRQNADPANARRAPLPYTPVGIESAPSALQSVYNYVAPHLGASEIHIPGVDQMGEDYGQAEDYIRGKLHAPAHPGDPGYLAAGVVGALAVPGPKGLRAAEEATKLPGIVGAGTRFVKGLGHVAAETAIPLRQGSVLGAVASQVPLALGANAVLTAQAKADSGAQQASGGVGSGTGAATAAASDQEVGVDPADYLSPELLTEYHAALKNNDTATVDEIENAVMDEHDRRQAAKTNINTTDLPVTTPAGATAQNVLQQPIWKTHPFETGLALTAALGGGMVARGIMKRMAIARVKGNPNLTGILTEGQYTDPASWAGGQTIQGDQPLRDAHRRMNGDGFLGQSKATKLALARLDRMTTPSLNTMTMHSMITGELPDSAVHISDPLAPRLEAFAKLDPGKQQVVSDGLLAASALDDYKRTGVMSSFLSPDEVARGVTAHDKSLQLQQQVGFMSNDPELAQWGRYFQGHYGTHSLDFMVDKGLITPAMAADMRAARPNYVHMSKTTRTDDTGSMLFGQRGGGGVQSASDRIDSLMARSGDEFSGVQQGAAADPIRELPDHWANLIKKAETNDYKRDFFDAAQNNSELKHFIKPLAEGHKVDDFHTVYRNGVAEDWQITDPSINHSARFMPSSLPANFETLLSIPKRMTERTITGPFNPFFAPIAMAYDTVGSQVLRPHGYGLGSINEGLTQAGLQKYVPDFVRGTVGMVDPTAWAAGPLGALRGAWDKLPETLAAHLTEELASGNGPASALFGPNAVQAWRDRFAAMYDGTITAAQDRAGATSTGFYGNANPATLSNGVAEVAPNYHEQQMYKIAEELAAGNASPLTSFLAGAGAKGSSINKWSKYYQDTMRLMHAGVRYSAFAANTPTTFGFVRAADRAVTPEAQLVASQTRRLAGDLAQMGSAPNVQAAVRQFLYLNPAIQGIAEFGRKFKNQPATHILNTVSTLAALSAVHYYTLANDPKAAAQYKLMTDGQKARTVMFPFGLTMPVIPEMQPLWGLNSAILDEVSGFNSGNFDPSWSDHWDHWMNSGDLNAQEDRASMAERVGAGLTSASPLNAASNPWISAIAAGAYGQDTGMTQFTGTPQLLQTQKVGELEGDGQLAGDLVSARTMHVFSDLSGGLITHMLRAGMDADRLVSDKGYSLDHMVDGAKIGLSRLEDNSVTAARPTKNLLFGDYPTVQSAATTEAGLWYKKAAGIDKAIQTLNQSEYEGQTSKNPKYALHSETDMIDRKYAGTALVPIGLVAARLHHDMAGLKEVLAQAVQEAKTNVPNQVGTSIKDRNIRVNYWNAQRRDIIQRMITTTAQAEETVRGLIGDPTFTFQGFDPKKYANVAWAAKGQELNPNAAADAGAGADQTVPADAEQQPLLQTEQ